MNSRTAQANARAGQAAVELAVFGAILIFLLGTIVRSAIGNSYTQNQNFKAMRMAMLASWNGAKAGGTSHNSASILFIEDRLSPDFNKYGSLDRNPFIANGSGTFTFQLLYPLDVGEVASNLPIMDVFINGQHFPFTTANYFSNVTISRPATCSYPAGSCAQNQCLRNQREWVGGTVLESEFTNIIPVSTSPTAGVQMDANASTIFKELASAGLIGGVLGTDLTQDGTGLTGNITSLVTGSNFISAYSNAFPGMTSAQLNQIQNVLQSNRSQYKLFYAMVANGEDTFSSNPPICLNPNTLACKDMALSSTLTMLDVNGNPYTNTTGDMEYDLLRLGNYTTPLTDPATETTYPAVEAQFPPAASCTAASLRCNIAWQWSATAATSNSQIGLVTSSNTNYPSYDVDGRLKPVTIYTFSQNPDGSPKISYEDFQGGDIDGTWDANSCGPKPGLQPDSQIFTFTQAGTYLQIKEGKLYNPETGQFVRSASQRDTIDLIQRIIQLSNNTGRYCSGSTPLATVAGDGVTPNPVEVCIAPGSGVNCFSSEQNIKSTCFDQNDNMLFVRSRLEDRRGNYWMTNASGQLQVQ